MSDSFDIDTTFQPSLNASTTTASTTTTTTTTTSKTQTASSTGSTSPNKNNTILKNDNNNVSSDATATIENKAANDTNDKNNNTTTSNDTNSNDTVVDVDDDDEKYQFAKAMALAIQNNPNLTPDEIHELFQTSGMMTGTTTTGTTTGTRTIGTTGKVSSTTTSTSTTTTTTPKEMFKTFRDNAKKGFTDILTKTNIVPSTATSSTVQQQSHVQQSQQVPELVQQQTTAVTTGGTSTSSGTSSTSTVPITTRTTAGTGTGTGIINETMIIATSPSPTPTPTGTSDDASYTNDLQSEVQVPKTVQTPIVQQLLPPSKTVAVTSTQSPVPVATTLKPAVSMSSIDSGTTTNTIDYSSFSDNNTSEKNTITTTATVLSTAAQAALNTKNVGVISVGDQQQQQQQQQPVQVQQGPVQVQGQVQKIQLSGIYWKRRGGFGKYKADAWERRRIELHGTTLYYYENIRSNTNKNTNNTNISSDTIVQSNTMDNSTAGSVSTGTSNNITNNNSYGKKTSWFEQATANFNITIGSNNTTTGTTGNDQFASASSGDDVWSTGTGIGDETITSNNNVGTAGTGTTTTTGMTAPTSTVTNTSTTITSTTNNNTNTPRGYLNLVKDKAVVHASMGHSGAPSPFAISIIVKNETKWKLCFDHHTDQMRWLTALTDVVVQNAVDTYNTSLLASIDPATYHTQFPPSISSTNIVTPSPVVHNKTTTTATMTTDVQQSSIDNNSTGPTSIFRQPPIRQPQRNSIEFGTIASTPSNDSTITTGSIPVPAGTGTAANKFSRLWMTQPYNIKSCNWDEENNKIISNNNNYNNKNDTTVLKKTVVITTEDANKEKLSTEIEVDQQMQRINDINKVGDLNVQAAAETEPKSIQQQLIDVNEMEIETNNSKSEVVNDNVAVVVVGDTLSLVPQHNWQYIAVVLNFTLWLTGSYWFIVVYSNVLIYYYMLSPIPTWKHFFILLTETLNTITKKLLKKKEPKKPATPKKLPPINVTSYQQQQQQQQQQKGAPISSVTSSTITVPSSNVIDDINDKSATDDTNVTDSITSRTLQDTAAAVTNNNGFVPMAGSSCIEIEIPSETGDDYDPSMSGWKKLPGNVLAVRSHDYPTSKRKVDSPGTLYSIFAVDVFESQCRHPDMARNVQLPDVSFDGEGDGTTITKTWASPDHFVISIALPTDPPNLIATSIDGGGYTITLYFAMTQETRDILKRITADGYDPAIELSEAQKKTSAQKDKCKVNAVRLFEEWIRRSPTDPNFQARFKVVPNAHNLKEIGMPGWIARYNGKPFLIKRSGETGFMYVHHDKSCVEFDISLHPFPYLARKGICFLKDSFFAKVVVTFGFTIEGRTEDELPECIIGLGQFSYPDPQYAIQADEFFSGPLPPEAFPPNRYVRPN